MFKCGLLLFWDHLAVSLCVPVCVFVKHARVCVCVCVCINEPTGFSRNELQKHLNYF